MAGAAKIPDCPIGNPIGSMHLHATDRLRHLDGVAQARQRERGANIGIDADIMVVCPQRDKRPPLGTRQALDQGRHRRDRGR